MNKHHNKSYTAISISKSNKISVFDYFVRPKYNTSGQKKICFLFLGFLPDCIPKYHSSHWKKKETVLISITFPKFEEEKKKWEKFKINMLLETWISENIMTPNDKRK